MCRKRLAANTGRKKVAKNRHLGTIAQLCRAISLQLRHVSTIGKKLVKQQYLLHMSPQHGNFGPLAAEIVSLVWGTPANFNRFGVLAALLDGTLVVGVSQTAALNRGRHLYLAGRPSRWALAHILVLLCFSVPMWYHSHWQPPWWWPSDYSLLETVQFFLADSTLRPRLDWLGTVLTSHLDVLQLHPVRVYL